MADNVGSKVTYFPVGLGVGALVGKSVCAKSGEETRDFLFRRRRMRAKIRAERRPRTGVSAPDSWSTRGQGKLRVQQKKIPSAAVEAGREGAYAARIEVLKAR